MESEIPWVTEGLPTRFFIFGMKKKIEGSERNERRGVDQAAACCYALCCLVLWSIYMYLLFDVSDLPQWFRVRCFSLLFQALVQISSRT